MSSEPQIVKSQNSMHSTPSADSMIEVDEKETEVVIYPDPFSSDRPSLEEQIRQGLKEMRQRTRKSRTARKRARQQARPEEPVMTKILFPMPETFRGCCHNMSFTIDRELLSRTAHCELLAKPRVKAQGEYPRLVRKIIPVASNHIKLLAQPKPYQVQDTISQHMCHLHPERLERMKERLNSKDYLTIQESRRFARQQRRDEKIWLRHRCRQEYKLKKRIIAMEIDYLRDTMYTIYRQSRDYFLLPLEAELEGDLDIASGIILGKMCNLIGLQIPKRNSDNIMDTFFCELADKLVLWMWKIMQASDVSFEKPEDEIRRLSAASSIFVDPTLDRTSSKAATEEEDLLTDAESLSIIRQILESFINLAILEGQDLTEFVNSMQSIGGASSLITE
ncbi:uncharacterized protein LOC129756224 [Uranotaenia lowii]|uniref:uncharacterized protein LOC129756224 n=1 Tax=Uranotaenia lowii TaxID=190385 RepID=UPI00247A3D32|nr:uncharacterized protein LOC129756224 [Uranotaenia lowii]